MLKKWQVSFSPCCPLCLCGKLSDCHKMDPPAMFQPTDDVRIKWTKVVLPPVLMEEEMPTT